MLWTDRTLTSEQNETCSQNGDLVTMCKHQTFRQGRLPEGQMMDRTQIVWCVCSFSEVQQLYSTSVFTELSTWTFPSIQSHAHFTKEMNSYKTICTKKNACYNVNFFSLQCCVYCRHEFSSVSPLCYALNGHRAVVSRLISMRCRPMWRLLSGRPWQLPQRLVLLVLPPTGAQSPLGLGFRGSCAQSSESHLELLSQRKQEK